MDRLIITPYCNAERGTVRPVHYAECITAQMEYSLKLFAFETKYPNYCRKCGGTGIKGYYDDPSPAGVSLSPGSMYFEDPCTDCTEHGHCPRCGAIWNIADYDCECECEKCGFRYAWGDPVNSESAPVKPECWCWESLDSWFGYGDYKHQWEGE